MRFGLKDAARVTFTLYVVAVVGFLAALFPSLLHAREGLSFQTITRVSSVPVAFFGVYFFTFMSFTAAMIVAYKRHSGLFAATMLAVSGVAFYEAIYGVSNAIYLGRIALLYPLPGLPATGWSGFGTWLMVEALVASLGVAWYPHFRLGAPAVFALASFLSLLCLWALLFQFEYPPFHNGIGIFVVNSLCEVAGSVFIPLLFYRSLDRPIVIPRPEES